jgi:RNA polymerase sigma-70 factor (ECF subfamily)
MTQRPETPDQLFRRFRASGDQQALGALFDQVAPLLRRRAVRLAPGLDAADDLLQATFLTALGRADRFDPARPVLPWLLGLLAVHAARLRRSAARVPDPERLRVSDAEDPWRAAADRELSQVVAEAVAELPPRYRGLVRGALYDGEGPQVLARRLARPPGTVRVQLRRGLAQLRRVLPASLATALALCWAPVRAAARGLAGRGRSPSSAPAAALLGPWGLGAGAALLLGVLTLAQSGLPSATRPGGAPVALWSAAQRPTARGDSLSLPPGLGRGLIGLPSARDPVRAPFVGEVTGLLAGTEAEARVRVVGRNGGRDLGPPLELELEPGAGAARFHFELGEVSTAGAAPDELVCSLVHADHRAEVRRVSIGSTAQVPHLVLEARPVATVELRLLDPLGRPLPRHFAALFPFAPGDERPSSSAAAHGRSDDEGRLVLGVESPGRHALLVAAAQWRPHTEVLELELGRRDRLGEVRLETGAHTAGIAHRGAAPAPAGTWIVARLTDAEPRYSLPGGERNLVLDWLAGRFEHTLRATRVQGSGGEFRLEGQAQRRYSVQVHLPAGGATPAPVEVFPSLDDLQLFDASARLALELPSGYRGPTTFEVALRAGGVEYPTREWDSGREARLVLACEPRSPLEIEFRRAGEVLLSLTSEAPGSGGERTLVLPLDPGPVGQLVLVDPPGGAELEGLDFLCTLAGDGLATRRARGRFENACWELSELPTGPWTVTLDPLRPLEPPTLLPPFEVRVEAGERRRVEVPALPAARLPIVVRGPDGRMLSAQVTRLGPSGASAPAVIESSLGTDGRLRDHRGEVTGALETALLLEPGAHLLRISAEGLEPRELEVEASAFGGGAPIEVQLVPPLAPR